MSLEDQTDDALRDLINQAQFELQVRFEIKRQMGLGPCMRTIWGPGPPYYCIPRCIHYEGHDGPCVRDKTKDECYEEWIGGMSSFADWTRLPREEAARRLA